MSQDPLKDGISSVQLMDVMGSDLTVVNAARVSMSKESVEHPSGSLYEHDERLISYLARHNHWTPFSHPQVSLRIKMPIFIARQWFKHQVGFARNEVSRRYVSDTPEFFLPTEWRGRAPNVKQGSSNEIVDTLRHFDPCTWESWQTEPMNLAALHNQASLQSYSELLDSGVCPEQARMVLPQSMYTEFIETGSLAAYARLCKLRLDPHAQLEVRQYAQVVSDLIEPYFPVSWKALTQ